jgi:Putative restriction endonuclease
MGSSEPQEVLRRHLVNVDEYYRMAEIGVLAPDARVELIEGEIIDMAPSSSRHSSAVMRLNHLLMPGLANQAIASVRSALRLSQRSEPQPDLMLLKPRADFYASGHPSADDVLLLVATPRPATTGASSSACTHATACAKSGSWTWTTTCCAPIATRWVSMMLRTTPR